MTRSTRRACAVFAVLLASAGPAHAQGAGRAFGRVSFFVDTAIRSPHDGVPMRTIELVTAATFRLPDADEPGVDVGIDLRYSRLSPGHRPQRVSLYDAFAGGRFGEQGQFRVLAGHVWLPDLGSVGALAGGLLEYRRGSREGGTRVRIGAFSGLEPFAYETGYAANVRKHGGYVSVERGALRRHVVGYAQVRNGSVAERSVVTTTNFIPGGRRLFVYQAAEFDVSGPAGGAADGGLSYFLANVRATPASRLEILATYSRGRSLDARRLADDLANGRPLSPLEIEGLRYESRGGRITVEVFRNVRIYGGYAQDRNNRDDAPTGRLLVGGHAGNLFGTGLSVSASSSRMERSTGSYDSRYVSVGRAIGRAVYVSADYSTSLSIARFLRSDGLIIETRPSSRRFAGNVNAVLGRHLSLLATADYTQDDVMNELRILTGLSYRLR